MSIPDAPTRLHANWWWLAAAVIALFLPWFFNKGIFLDGALYAGIARNMAEGLGSFWKPYYTDFLYPQFYEHPPLFFGLEALLFKLFGDRVYTERVFALLLLSLSAVFLFQVLPGKRHQKPLWPTLWLLIPVVHWTFQNNMIEMLLVLLFLMAIWAWRQSWNRWLRCLVLSLLGGLIFLAKGPVALGVICIPFCLEPISAWRRTAVSMVTIFILMAAMMALLLLYDPAHQNLKAWFHKQLWGTLSGARSSEHAASRWAIVKELIEQSILPVLVGVGLKLLHPNRTWRVRGSLAWLLLWLALSLPFVISPKQHYYYFSPAMAVLVIFVANWVQSDLRFFVDRYLQKPMTMLLLWVPKCSVLIAVVWSIYVFGTPNRQADMLDDLEWIAKVEVEGRIGVTRELKANYGLLANGMRYHHLSIDIHSLDAEWFVSTRNHPKAQLLTPEAKKYKLFRRIND